MGPRQESASALGSSPSLEGVASVGTRGAMSATDFEASVSDLAPGLYGYPHLEGFDLQEFRRRELPQLNGTVYLDYAGAAPYTHTQLKASFSALSSRLFANPHTHADISPSASSAEAIGQLRLQVLALLGVDAEQYCCIFTSGATGALKLLAECFPWGEGGRFAYTLQNHNSVLGIRENALASGATATCVEVRCPGAPPSPPWGRQADADAALPCPPAAALQLSLTAHLPAHTGSLSPRHPKCQGQPAGGRGGGGGSPGMGERRAEGVVESAVAGCDPGVPCLFAMPVECNFSGQRMDLDLVHAIQAGTLPVPGPASQDQDQEQDHDHEQKPHVGQGSCTGHGEASTAPVGPAREGPREREKWYVLLDAAKACATSPPDLSRCQADFCALSFYKMFGYPTGLGALIARRDALGVLRKRYFGGGTVSASAAESRFFVPKQSAEEWFEDGTPAFLDIAAALPPGLALLRRLTFDRISTHSGFLASLSACALASLRHPKGSPACVLYGRHGVAEWDGAGVGPVVAFNVLRSDGAMVGHREVATLASLHSLVLRTGSFCNPGACSLHLGVSLSDRVELAQAGASCWDDHDLLHGRPMGAVRASFGYASSVADALALVRFVQECFVEGPPCDVQGLLLGLAARMAHRQTKRAPPRGARGAHWQQSPGPRPGALQSPARLVTEPHLRSEPAAEDNLAAAAAAAPPAPIEAENPGVVGLQVDSIPDPLPLVSEGVHRREGVVRVEALYVYPIKSCAAMAVSKWPLGDNGLLFDREWVLLDARGTPLKARQHPAMCRLQPRIDLQTHEMLLFNPEMPGGPLRIALDTEGEDVAPQERVTVCGDRVTGWRYTRREVCDWLEQALGVPCRLVRQVSGARCVRRGVPGGVPSPARNEETGGGRRDGDAQGVSNSAAVLHQGREGEGSGTDASFKASVSPAHGAEGIGFANEAQFLVVSGASVADLNKRLLLSHSREGLPRADSASGDAAVQVCALRFRPNLVVDAPGLQAYVEEGWRALTSLEAQPQLRLGARGGCSRCAMVNLDPNTGASTGLEPLRTLSRFRRTGSKIVFGALFARESPASGLMQVGDWLSVS